jgi:hypothetical protein
MDNFYPVQPQLGNGGDMSKAKWLIIPVVAASVFMFPLLARRAWVNFTDSLVDHAGRKERAAEVWSSETYNIIAYLAKNDVLVEGGKPEVYVGGTMNCVGATGLLRYTTDRLFEDVLATYSEALQAAWSVKKSEEVTIFYESDDDFIKYISIYPDEEAKVRTGYWVRSFMQEPRCAVICPEWQEACSTGD